MMRDDDGHSITIDNMLEIEARILITKMLESKLGLSLTHLLDVTGVSRHVVPKGCYQVIFAVSGKIVAYCVHVVATLWHVAIVARDANSALVGPRAMW